MAAEVMKALDFSLSVPDEEEIEPSFSNLKKISIVDKPGSVSYHQPFLGEDCTSFKVVHGLGSIPRSWQGSNCCRGPVALRGELEPADGIVGLFKLGPKQKHDSD